MAKTFLDEFGIATTALGGKIMLGRISRRDSRTFTQKREAEGEVMRAVVDHMMLDCPKGSEKVMSFDGLKTWFKIRVEPCPAPDPDPQEGTSERA